ncbi:hypothetical protein P7K49_012705 [Saguinus oedipus]|uniref:Uncharacterized protein n=1 Tax=Saguinus oedipus TaxID=9490 RepID=A0ABQ9VDU3_SAGOE|nr:hypothetical protein P7K49_012705 [Saguinus oedipus]
MRALPPPAPLLPLLLLLALLVAPAARASRAESVSAPQPERQRESRPPPGPGPGNATRTGSGAAGGGSSSNSSGNALVTRISTLLRDLPTLKAAVIVAFAFTTLLIACLLLRGAIANLLHRAPAPPARTGALGQPRASCPAQDEACFALGIGAGLQDAWRPLVASLTFY